MTDDAQAQEVHATVTDSGLRPGPGTDDRPDSPDVADGDHVIVPGADETGAQDGTNAQDHADDADGALGALGVAASADETAGPDVIYSAGEAGVAGVSEPREAGLGTEAGAAEDAGDPDAVIISEGPPASAAGDSARDRAVITSAIAQENTDGVATTHPDTAPSQAVPPDAPAAAGEPDDLELMHKRWASIQSTFVDDPRGSVAAAAELVTEAIAALVASVQERERGLRGDWDRDGVDTERLRNVLRGYRGLLDRVVAQ